jgi:hypothetical protein
MSGVNSIQRIAAWNVEFLDNGDKSFAGLYQARNMLTYRDALEELQLCFQLNHYDALTLWRVTLDEEDQTLDDVCIPAAASAGVLNRAVRIQASSLSNPSMLTKTRYMLLNHYSERCTREHILDVKDHIAGRRSILH